MKIEAEAVMIASRAKQHLDSQKLKEVRPLSL